MAEAEGLGPVAEDRLLDARLRLLQPVKGHRAGTDAVLLAASVPDLGTGVLADLGAGVGTVGLAVALAQPEVAVTLVERHEAVAELARANLALNGIEGRGRVVVADVAAPASVQRAAGLEPGSFACVATNPPFLDRASVKASANDYRRAAHIDEAGLEAWVAAARRLLAPRGVLCVIHRADALPALLAALGRGFGAVAIRAIHPRAEKPATRVLVCARLGSRRPARIEPAVVLHGPDGRFTPEAEALHRGYLRLPYQ